MRKKTRQQVDTSLFPHFPVLIIDDDPITLETVDFILHSNGVNNTIMCSDSRKIMKILSRQAVSVILLDLIMPHISGEELLSRITEQYPEAPVIIITGVQEIEVAVTCMKSRAYDYILKPLDETRLITSVSRAIEYREVQTEIKLLKGRLFAESLENPDDFSDIVTQNRTMFAIFRYVEAVAKSAYPVLITGETGVGKSLLAEAIHKSSMRAGGIIHLNVSGLKNSTFADKLFGRQKSGRSRGKEGLLKTAANGTVFLNDIADLKPESQLLLLRLIQEKEYFPAGEDVPVRMETRIIAATHQDLKSLTEKEKFRKDLFYRLYQHHIHFPALRERPEDVPLLIDHFLEAAAAEYKKKKPTPPPQLTDLLSNYDFPGNVRELKSMIYDSVAVHQSKMLSMKIIKEYVGKDASARRSRLLKPFKKDYFYVSSWDLLPTIKEITNVLVAEALRRADGNKSVAAQMLGVTRQTISKYAPPVKKTPGKMRRRRPRRQAK